MNTDIVVQFIKFGIVGVSNTVVSYAINIGVLYCMRGLHMSWDFVVANVVSFFLSVLWSFFWNNRFVFKTEYNEKYSVTKTLLKTYVAYGFTGIILNNVLGFVWVSCLGISKYIAPIFNLFISVPLNFFINKFWAFKN